MRGTLRRTFSAAGGHFHKVRLVAALRCAAAAAIVALGMSGTAAALGPGDWQADLDALQAGLARNYANFEYTLTERRIDLPRLAARARDALASATDDRERRRVLEQLLRDLRDPHVSITWPPEKPKPAAAAAVQEDARPPAAAACPPDLASLATRPGIAFARLPGYRALADAEARWFDAGLATDRNGQVLGVLRIGIFLERAYAPACAEAATALGLRPQDPCDEACTERVERATVQRLNAALALTVRELEQDGAKQLVIDVTDNGGGSDWAEVLARILGGPLQSARIALLKHPAWAAWLEDQIAQMEAAREMASPHRQQRLARAAREYAKLRESVAVSCDLSGAWTDRELAMGQKPLPCTTLAVGELYATGPEAGWPVPPSDPADADGLLFRMAWYGPALVGITQLPLVVVVNDDTHSAAEQFAAVLRDNRRARVIGTPSAGAGCGTYTEKGTSFTLPATGAVVHVPDCVRLRADGSNERGGIVPDRLIPWAPSDSAYQRVQKTIDALSARTP
jgi:hypothetical protein